MLSFGYAGKVYPVNPNESQILGLQTYSRVGDIPEPVDFATITVPAQGVPEIVEECLAKGVKAVQILTAGFGEISEEGQKLEEEVAKIAAKGKTKPKAKSARPARKKVGHHASAVAARRARKKK